MNKFKTILLFAIGIIICGFTLSYAKVYFLNDFDPKYLDAPGSAFELELLGLIAMTVIVVTVFVIGMYFMSKFRENITLKSSLVPFILGLLCPIGIEVIYKILKAFVSIESLLFPVVGWSYLILFPLITATFVFRKV